MARPNDSWSEHIGVEASLAIGLRF
jgi:hypothetical protein